MLLSIVLHKVFYCKKTNKLKQYNSRRNNLTIIHSRYPTARPQRSINIIAQNLE